VPRSSYAGFFTEVQPCLEVLDEIKQFLALNRREFVVLMLTRKKENKDLRTVNFPDNENSVIENQLNPLPIYRESRDVRSLTVRDVRGKILLVSDMEINGAHKMG